MLLFLRILPFGQDVNGDSRPELERIYEYFALVDIRKLVPAIIELFKRFFLLVRKHSEKRLMMVGNVAHQLFDFWCGFAAALVWAYISVPQFFKYALHKFTSL